MDTDYDEAWRALPESLRQRLRANVDAELTGDDVTALNRVHPMVSMAYWVTSAPEEGSRWHLNSGLREYILALDEDGSARASDSA